MDNKKLKAEGWKVRLLATYLQSGGVSEVNIRRCTRARRDNFEIILPSHDQHEDISFQKRSDKCVAKP